jgi:hypothetical protein
VDAAPQSGGAGGQKDALGFGDRERAVFGEHVDAFGDAFLGDRGDFGNHQIDVGLPVVPIFERQRVGAHVRDRQIDRMRRVQTVHHRKHLPFGRNVQTVAALGFDRRDAKG